MRAISMDFVNKAISSCLICSSCQPCRQITARTVVDQELHLRASCETNFPCFHIYREAWNICVAKGLSRGGVEHYLTWYLEADEVWELLMCDDLSNALHPFLQSHLLLKPVGNNCSSCNASCIVPCVLSSSSFKPCMVPFQSSID